MEYLLNDGVASILDCSSCTKCLASVVLPLHGYPVKSTSGIFLLNCLFSFFKSFTRSLYPHSDTLLFKFHLFIKYSSFLFPSRWRWQNGKKSKKKKKKDFFSIIYRENMSKPSAVCMYAVFSISGVRKEWHNDLQLIFPYINMLLDMSLIKQVQ